MAQQINLCTPILLTQKRYFSALAMVQALGLLIVVGGGLGAYWVWSLQAASDALRQTVSAHALESVSLKAAIQASKAVAKPLDPALVKELQVRRAEVDRREKVLVALGRGLYKEGLGQSARLQLVAQTIPAQVWVTGIRADDTLIDVSGFTLEPAVLNDWVRRLADSPVLQGQQLATVKVERARTDLSVNAMGAGTNGPNGSAPVVPGPGSAASAPQRPVWAFSLVSAVAPTGRLARGTGGAP